MGLCTKKASEEQVKKSFSDVRKDVNELRDRIIALEEALKVKNAKK